MTSHQNEFYEGHRLVKDIKTDQHGLLLSKGAILDHKTIQRLTYFNVSLTDFAECIEKDTKTTLEQHMDQLIQNFQKKFDQIDSGRKVTDEIEKELMPKISKMIEEAGIDEIMIFVQSKDDYLYRHNLAVALLSGKLASWLGYSKEKINRIAFSGLLHDVGKTKIPSEILQKTERLTQHEYEIIKCHTQFGYDMLKNQNLDEDVCRAALEHHLREDGTGYPATMQGQPIHEFAQVIAIADTFHAMTSNRVYRKGLSFYFALKELRNDQFGKLNPKMANTFIQKIMELSVGSQVQLSDGRVGQVIFIPSNDPINPYVQIESEVIDTCSSNTHIEHFLQQMDPVKV